jgi:WD40 repeat protein
VRPLFDRLIVACWTLLVTGMLAVSGCREQVGPVISYAGPLPEGAVARLGKGEITSLDFKPAAGMLYAGSKVGVTHYDTTNFQEKWQFATEHAVRKVAASKDGGRLLAGLENGTLLLLDGRNGALLESWPGYEEIVGIQALAWAENEINGGAYAAAGFDDGNILLLRRGDEEVQTIGGLPRQGTGISALAFDPHGRILATGNKKGELYLIDLQSQVLLGTLAGHEKSIEDIAWSPDNAQFLGDAQSLGDARLVSGDKDGVVIEWDLTSLSPAQIWPAEEDPIIDVSYLSGGEQGVLATAGGMVERWTAGQTVEGVRATLEQGLLAIAWDSSGTQVATAGADGLLHIWPPIGAEGWPGKAAQTLVGHAPKAKQALVVAYAPRGEALLSSLGNDIAIWNPRRAVPEVTFSSHEDSVSAAAWSPDATRVASADRGGRIYVWDASSGDVSLTLDRHTRPVSALSWSPDGKMLASAGSLADEVVVWDSQDGAILHELQGDGDGLWSVSWSPDGRRLAAGSSEGKLFIWETADFDVQPDRFWRHQSWISDLEWFDDSQRLISGSGDTLVILWDMEQGTTTLFPGHSAPVRGVSLSPDEAYAVSAAINGEAIIWDLNPQAEDKIAARLVGHTDGMTAVSWSPDGRSIATASEDGTVLVWDDGFEQEE